MERINLNVDKNKKYVLACSFGPDSMALLDAAIKEKLNFVVAHVNYRKRDVSEFEQHSLEKFCNERDIKIFVLDLKGVKATKNFQAWARTVRYDFFKKILTEEKADAVLVAHQEDDVIETYLMQKNRGNFVKSWGISEKTEIFGVEVIRPLLSFSKKFLEDYDRVNNIPYSIDESNLTDHYSRNKIRHSIVEKLKDVQRKTIIDEIKKQAVNNIEPKTTFTYEEFKALSYDETVSTLSFYMDKTKEHRDLSKKFVNEIKKAFRSNSTHRVELTSKIWLEKDYEDVYLVNASKIRGYQKTFVNKMKNDFITIDFSMGADDRGISVHNNKLIVKNLDKNEYYIIIDYSSKVSRLFIDWKLPLFLREVWPGIYGENLNLIYVPRYRKNYQETHTSKFKINTSYFLEF